MNKTLQLLPHIFCCLFVSFSNFVNAGVNGEVQIREEKELVGDYSFDYEIVIDAPVDQVWPHLLDLGSWIEDVEFVSATPDKKNQAGEIIYFYSKAIPAEQRNASNRMIAKLLEVKQNRFLYYVNPIVISDTTGVIRSGSNLLTLTNVNGKTRVNFYGSKSLRMPFGRLEEFYANTNRILANSREAWVDRYLPRLKELAENE